MNNLPPLFSLRLHAFARLTRWLFGLLVAAWLLFFGMWALLHGWIVPRIVELRPRLEQQASQVLGVPVRIGEIRARSQGLIPSFELLNVSLLGPRGEQALLLPRILASLSPRSLWHRGFEQLYIDSPELDVRRAADGRITVAGLALGQVGSSADNATTDWLFEQTEVVIRNGLVRWTDAQRKAQTLSLTQVDLVMRNDAQRHLFRLDATPPPEWGQRFSLRARLRHPLFSLRRGQWQQWQGEVYAHFPQVDLSRLNQQADLGLDVRQGTGALRVWAEVDHASLRDVVADVALAQVVTTLEPRLPTLEMDRVSGRLGGRRRADGLEFYTQDLAFRARNGHEWPGGNIWVKLLPGTAQTPGQGEFRGEKLDLAAMAQIADHFPLPSAVRQALTGYQPQGLVQKLQASWQDGPPGDGAAALLQAQGRITQLALNRLPADQPSPWPGLDLPGLQGANLDFELKPQGGMLRLEIERGQLQLPHSLDIAPVPLDRLAADLKWQLQGSKLALDLTRLSLANADLEGEAQAHWRSPDDGVVSAEQPGTLDLHASASRLDVASLHRYLPAQMPAPARAYLREALLKGQASAVRLRIKGDLAHFPFAQARQGEFRVTGQVRNATYQYVPASLLPKGSAGWPALTQLKADVVLDRQSLSLQNASAKWLGAPGLQITRVDASLPSYDPLGTVQVDAQGKGPAAELLALLAASPVDGWLDQGLSRASANGTADYRLKLQLPLLDLDKAKVQGSIVLAGNDVQVSPALPPFSRVRGSFNFNESGFVLNGLQARFLGGDLRVDGGSRSAGAPAVAGSDAPIVLRAQGQLSADGLRAARELGPLARLGRVASGATSYSATLGFRRGVPELSLHSTLQGLGLDLPEPLRKSAEAALPLHYESSLLRDSANPATPAQRLQDQLRVELGQVFAAHYVRSLAGSDPVVLRGALALGAAAGPLGNLPEHDVQAKLVLDSLNLDAWLAVLAEPASSAPAAVPPLAAAAQRYWPSALSLHTPELQWQGRRVADVTLGMTRDGSTWRANIDARELGGYLEYRQQAQGQPAGRVYARLARLAVGPANLGDVESLLDAQPTAIPALDVVVDQLELRGKQLGRVVIDAVNHSQGPATGREVAQNEWRLNKLSIQVPEASFNATGNWAALGGPRAAAVERRRTIMNFKLDIQDAGQFLARLGMPEVFRAGKGLMEGQVGWVGSPLALDAPSLNGQFSINLENGQFLKADPGIAKLLGVLSLQSLPRRLTLDFRDVFSDGFAFDFVRGDVHIDQGQASTNNLQMKGVNAAVLMEGRADIARETQHLHVVVVPEINAGTASLVATAVNPLVGLSTFLAQLFLRKPLSQATTQEFLIDGTWTEPRIVRVEHKADSSAPPSGNAP